MHQVAAVDGNWLIVTPADEELVARAKLGGRHALEELLRRYRGLVEGKARLYYLAGADHEDVVQEGMIGLFKAVRDFEGGRPAGFRSFADLCVTRQIITAVKAACRHKHVALNTYVSMDSPALNREAEQCLADILEEPREPNPEDVILGRQFHDEVNWRMSNELSPMEARALKLYLQGRSYTEIAVDLRCKIKQIDNALQRAKRKISRGLWPSLKAG